MPTARLGTWLLWFVVCHAVGCGQSGADTDAFRVDVAVESGDAVEEIVCREGLVLWPQGVCAPRVEECQNPWDLPVLSMDGGGCLPIGPRACPRNYDPNSQADCEYGDLLDCPEGFVLTESNMACIPFFQDDCGDSAVPILGGGCKKVGPDWGGGAADYFEDCGPVGLAMPGGGCVQVGPRACPKLWDANADVECDVGDVLPCPDGAMVSNDNQYCVPVLDECKAGELPVPGGGCGHVLPLAEDCPKGPFPAIPDGDGEVVFVDIESTCAENCGTAEVPFPSIQQAVDAAPDGARILVAAGSYDEHISISKPICVIGLCPAKVKITGSALVDHIDFDYKLAAISVVETSGVVLQGLTIEAPARGLVGKKVQDLMLSSMRFVDCVNTAIMLKQSSGTVADVLVSGLQDTEQETGERGNGIWIRYGSKVKLERTVVEQVQGNGIRVSGVGTKMTASGLAVRDGQLSSQGENGTGLALDYKGTATVEHAVFERLINNALSAYDEGSHLYLNGSVVRDVEKGQQGKGGLGCELALGGAITLTDSLVESTAVAGMLAIGPGSSATAERTVFRDSNSDGIYTGGGAILASNGGSATAIATAIVDSRSAGAISIDSGSRVELVGCLVDTVSTSPSIPLVRGATAEFGAELSVTDSVIRGVVGAGVRLTFGSSGKIKRTSIRDVTTVWMETGGIGISNQSSVLVVDSLVEDCTGLGMWFLDSTGTVEGCVVRDTAPLPGDKHGAGVLLGSGSKVEFTQTLLERNFILGLGVYDDNSKAVVKDCVVRGTTADNDLKYGYGLEASYGGALEVVDTLLVENEGAGILVGQFDEEGGSTGPSSGLLRGCAVGRTNHEGADHPGLGIHVLNDAEATVEATFLFDNRGAGVSAVGATAQLEVTSSVVRGTLVDLADTGGFGILAQAGATVEVTASLVEETIGVGVMGVGDDTVISLLNTTVRDTNPTTFFGRFGFGLSMVSGQMIAHGCLVIRDFSKGFLFTGPNVQAVLAGNIIQETEARTMDAAHGLWSQSGAKVVVHRTLFSGNGLASASAWGPETHLVVEESLVVETVRGLTSVSKLSGEGEVQAFADGLSAGESAVLDVVDSIVLSSGRCGLYFLEASGTVSGTVVADNASFGVAMEDSPGVILDSSNYIFGNGTALPPAQASDVTDNPMGLPSPAAPDVNGLGDY